MSLYVKEESKSFWEILGGIFMAPLSCASVSETQEEDANTDISTRDTRSTETTDMLDGYCRVDKMEREDVTTLSLDIPNFSGTAKLFFTLGTSEGERENLIEQTQDAANFVAHFAKTHLKTQNRFKELHIANDFWSHDIPQTFARWKANQLQLKDIQPGDAEFLSAALSAFMVQTYLYPGLGNDPYLLLEFGLTAHVSQIFTGEISLFPSEPVTPILKLENTDDLEWGTYAPYYTVTDIYGNAHEIKLLSNDFANDRSNELAELISIRLDGIDYNLYYYDSDEYGTEKTGPRCTVADESNLPEGTENQYFVCPSKDHSGNLSILIFDKDDTIERDLLKTLSATSPRITYPDQALLWGYDINNNPRVFKERNDENYTRGIHFSPLAEDRDTPPERQSSQIPVYTGFNKEDIDNEGLRYASIPIQALQQLYWQEHPERNPNTIYEAFGRLANEYLEDHESVHYQNMYERVCNALDLSRTKCFDLFEMLGIDPEEVDYSEYTYCSPSLYN